MPSRDVGPSNLPWVVTRTRVMQLLAQRWQHRVVSVVAGAGFGKSIAMALGISAPPPDDDRTRRTDHLVRLDSSMGSVSKFASRLAAALDVDDATGDPAQVVSELADREGDHCVILDDVHTLSADSSAARALHGIVEGLPANVGLVLLSRSQPPVPLARLRAAGSVLDIGEDELAYDTEELAEIAGLTGAAAADLEQTGGWPALVSLVVSRGHHGAWEFLAEEVLGTLAPAWRDALTVAALTDGADARLLRDVAGCDEDPRSIAAEVPLIPIDADDRLVPHTLWATVLDSTLTGAHRDRLLRGLADHLLDRDEPLTALRVALRLGDQDVLARVVRALCREEFIGFGTADLSRMLDDAPPGFLDFPEGRLLAAVLAAHRDPMSDATRSALQDSAREFRRLRDPDCEIVALSELALVLRWQGQSIRLLLIIRRLSALASHGHVIAARLISFARAGLADRRGDSTKVLEELADLRPGHLHDRWISLVEFLRCNQLLNLGRMREAHDAAVRSRDLAMPGFNGGWCAQLIAAWHQGVTRDKVTQLPIADEVESTFPVERIWVGAWCGAMHAYAGMHRQAAHNIAAADQALHARTDAQLVGFVVWAQAAMAISEHDESRARSVLRGYLRRHPIRTPLGQRLAARAPAVFDLLLGDELPAGWSASLGGPWQQTALSSAAALRSFRAGQDVDRLPDPGIVLSALPLPWALELAAHAAEAEHPDAAALARRIADVSGDAARDEIELHLPAGLRAPAAQLFDEIRIGPDRRATALASLTVAERRVLDEVARGLTNQQIANRLEISARTVANHLYNAYPKLDVSSRTEAAVLVRLST